MRTLRETRLDLIRRILDAKAKKQGTQALQKLLIDTTVRELRTNIRKRA